MIVGVIHPSSSQGPGGALSPFSPVIPVASLTLLYDPSAYQQHFQISILLAFLQGPHKVRTNLFSGDGPGIVIKLNCYHSMLQYGVQSNKKVPLLICVTLFSLHTPWYSFTVSSLVDYSSPIAKQFTNSIVSPYWLKLACSSKCMS